MLSEMEQLDGLMLVEDFLNEGPLDMLKKAGDWARDKGTAFVSKVKRAVTNVLSKIKGVLTKIAKMGKKMFASLMNFFGVEVGSATGIPGSIEL